MKIKDLVKKLEEFDPDSLVRVDAGTGVEMPARSVEYYDLDDLPIVVIK